MQAHYSPDRGDIVWLQFSPQVGHEQAGQRPALTISPHAYNKKVGLGIFCPITSHEKGYPFEVLIPRSMPINGVILCDQVKSMDWKARHARFIAKLPEDSLENVLAKIHTLFR